MTKFIRTKNDFLKLNFELKRPEKPYKEILTKKEAHNLLRDNSDELSEIELAEICANGGAFLNDGSVLTAW